MTFRKPDESRMIMKLYQSVYYWQNKDRIQEQQRQYRENNKDRVRVITNKASLRYQKKNSNTYKMYRQLRLLVKKDGLW